MSALGTNSDEIHWLWVFLTLTLAVWKRGKLSKDENDFSKIEVNQTRLRISSHLSESLRNVRSITFAGSNVFTQPRPKADVAGGRFTSVHSGRGSSALGLDERRSLQRSITRIALSFIDKPVAETTYGGALERFGRGDRVITKLSRPKAIIGFDEFARPKCLHDISIAKKRQPLPGDGRGND
jgi:hypothetical protein